MKNRIRTAVLAGIALLASGSALAGSKADIVVMTQNQYLGADLTPIIAAPDLSTANAAIIQALNTMSANNYPERVQALAETIHDKQPHLVALQEMYRFSCFDPMYPPNPLDPLSNGRCALFPNAFNDYVTATVDELDGGFEAVATVQNLNLTVPVAFGLNPATDWIYVTVVDRDVILARADVAASVEAVDFGCFKASVDGCNYEAVFEIEDGPLPVTIERGFVGVDATVNGVDYRFVNTHLEVQTLGGVPESMIYQAAQAGELVQAIFGNFDPTKRLIVAGDFNSSPGDESTACLPDLGCLPTPYERLATYFTDTWYLRPGKPPGYTCCELGDLSNAPSLHDERIDLVFSGPAPVKVKANVLDAEVEDKTLSGLWPSDHASVSAELSY